MSLSELVFSSSPASNNFQDEIWLQSNLNRSNKILNLFKDLKLSISTIVDLGCGDGAIAKILANSGFNLRCYDARENVPEYFLNDGRFNISFNKFDVEVDDFQLISPNPSVLMILGLLYHLENPYQFIKNVKKINSEYVILDSVVLDHDGVAIIYLREESTVNGNSINGGANRPSPGWIIQSFLEINYELILDMSDASLDIPSNEKSTGHLYSWGFERTCGWRRNDQQLRKMLVFKKIT